MTTTPQTTIHPEPEPRDVDWPRLVEICERRQLPVMRVDVHGQTHIVRTLAQLHSEWEPTTTNLPDQPGTRAGRRVRLSDKKGTTP